MGESVGGERKQNRAEKRRDVEKSGEERVGSKQECEGKERLGKGSKREERRRGE